MSGPCLCGDPACPRCFPGNAELSDAEPEIQVRVTISTLDGEVLETFTVSPIQEARYSLLKGSEKLARFAHNIFNYLDDNYEVDNL
jgi:hypothetical protein